MIVAFGDIYYATAPVAASDTHPRLLYAGIWALALGGLGAISSIFLDIMKLIPQQTLRSSDEFEVLVRILLGVLFSFVLSITIIPKNMTDFFDAMATSNGDPKQGALLLAPFLMGYSLPLVLGLLDKAIKAVEMTIGVEDRRSDPLQSRPRIIKGRRSWFFSYEDRILAKIWWRIIILYMLDRHWMRYENYVRIIG